MNKLSTPRYQASIFLLKKVYKITDENTINLILYLAERESIKTNFVGIFNEDIFVSNGIPQIMYGTSKGTGASVTASLSISNISRIMDIVFKFEGRSYEDILNTVKLLPEVMKATEDSEITVKEIIKGFGFPRAETNRRIKEYDVAKSRILNNG